MLGRELKDYYKRLFGLAHQHHHSISDLEDMISYEMDLLIDFINDEAKKAEQEAGKEAGVQYAFDPEEIAKATKSSKAPTEPHPSPPASLKSTMKKGCG